MKWFNLSGIDLGLSFRYLLRREQGLRENSIVVVPLQGSKKDVDRKIIRPWQPLPNVKKFKIELRSRDWLFTLAGLTKRIQPKMKFYMWRNASMNRYVDYMFKRLRKQVENKLYKKALKTVWILMNSVSYQIIAYNHVNHNWHRIKPLWLVKQQLLHVSKLAQKKSYKIEYHRAYIPKGETWRPLGVPSVAWRVYLHMLNNLIVEWRMVTEGESQHGFIPGRGILTAWKRLFKLLKYPYVYEIDYKQFFDMVSLIGLRSQMVRMGFPIKFALFIEQLNRFPIDIEYMKLNELPSMSKLVDYARQHPEFEFRKMSNLVKTIIAIYRGTYSGEPINLKEVLRSDSTGKLTMSDVANTLFGLSAYSIYGISRSSYGVPQGAPTSCSLSTLILREIEERARKLGLELVCYADDVILAGPVEFDPSSILEDKALGLNINWNKSGWVKYEGIWRATGTYKMIDAKSEERGLKFLGIRYYPALWVQIRDYISAYWRTGIARPVNFQPFRLVEQLKDYRQRDQWLEIFRSKWQAETRNGARLELTLKISFLAYLAKARDIALKYINSPYVKQYATLGEWLKSCDKRWSVLWDQVKSVSNSPIYGWIVSRMQNDSWTREGDTIQNFQWRATKLSWASLRWKNYKSEHHIKDPLTIFTSSTFACHDLASWLTNKRRSAKSR